MSDNNIAGPALRRNLARGLHYFIVWQTVAGTESCELPILYIVPSPGSDPEPVLLLIDYCKNHMGLSSTWMLDRLRSVGALVDWLMQNRSHYACLAEERPTANLRRLAIRDFIEALVKGTMKFRDGEMVDDTGLYWLGLSLSVVEARIDALRDIASWLDTQGYGDTLSMAVLPRIPSDPSGALDFLYVTQVVKRISLMTHVRAYRRVAPRSVRDAFGRKGTTAGEPNYFPPKHTTRMLTEGFKVRGTAIDESAQLLAFLLLFGGLRSSEPLNLWVTDFSYMNGLANLTLYHPAHSMVTDPRGNRMTRRQYLWVHHGMLPRCDYRKGRLAAGWKGLKGDIEGSLVYWLPTPGVNELMASVIHHYIKHVRGPAMRTRIGLGYRDHPFLLVSTGSHAGEEIGAPYALEAAKGAWKRAIGRLRNLTGDPDLRHAKAAGTTLHGCRHYYAKYLETIGVDAAFRQECLHHRSPYSQLAYEHRSAEEISAALNAASQRQATGIEMPQGNWSTSDTLKRSLEWIAKQSW